MYGLETSLSAPYGPVTSHGLTLDQNAERAMHGGKVDIVLCEEIDKFFQPSLGIENVLQN